MITGIRSYRRPGRSYARHSDIEAGQGGPGAGLTRGSGYAVVSDLIAGMLAYGGIGWVIGHFTHLSLLFPAGLLIGLAISTGWVVYQYGRPHELGNQHPPKGDDR